MPYALALTQLFQDNFRLLPKGQEQLVQSKLDLLKQDPRPLGKNKTALVGTRKPKRFRMKAGNYRIIYTYTSTTVELINVDKRAEVYVRHTAKGVVPVDENQVSDDLIDVEVQEIDQSASATWQSFHRKRKTWFETPAEGSSWSIPQTTSDADQPHTGPSPLPAPITQEMLERIRIPEKYHRVLLACQTDDALIDSITSEGIPEALVDRVFKLVTEPSYDDIDDQPVGTLLEIDDLQRFYDHTLLDLLVTLDPGQETISRAITSSSGAWLVKGAPGTGKSTILLDAAIRKHHEASRNGTRGNILVTTYTNALVTTLEHMLEQMYPGSTPDMTVCTLDRLAIDIVREAGEHRINLDAQHHRGRLQGHLRRITREILEPERGTGSSPGLYVDMAPFPAMTWQYLQEEIEHVIVGWNITERDDYLTTPRPGRRVSLRDGQRNRIWDIAAALDRELLHNNQTTLARLRRRAADLLASGTVRRNFDSIFVDEAQDLDQNGIRLLVELALNPNGEINRLCLVADENQTIYGSGISWVSIHPALRLQGRTRPLTINHRSTRQILEAAQSFLSGAELEQKARDAAPVRHRNSGPLPSVIPGVSPDGEVGLILEFFARQCGEIGRDQDMCAILVPNQWHGRSIEHRLRERGIRARYMQKGAIDLQFDGIKILTQHSAKGLEFPIVAVSLLGHSSLETLQPDESSESRMRFQRLLHMAMTRAMRSLLVTLPPGIDDRILEKFNSSGWTLLPES